MLLTLSDLRWANMVSFSSFVYLDQMDRDKRFTTQHHAQIEADWGHNISRTINLQ